MLRLDTSSDGFTSRAPFSGGSSYCGVRGGFCPVGYHGDIETVRSWIFASTAVALTAYLRWQLADLADWGIDESANLWLASSILSGHDIPLGLLSSHGVPNLSGAPLLATPLAALPELVSISRALSLLHLGALGALSLTLRRRGGTAATTMAILAFFPALLLASSTLWNQYLTIPLAAIIISLLLFLADEPAGAVEQACALVAFVLIALMLPATHLAGFADLVVYSTLLALVLSVRPRRIERSVLAIGVLAVLTAMAHVYRPWMAWAARFTGPRTFWFAAMIAAVAVTGGIAILMRSAKAAAARAEASQRASWWCFAALCFCLGASAILPFGGAQVGRRLLLLGRPVGFVLLAAQLGIVLAFLPGVRRVHEDCRRGFTAGALLRKHYSNPTAAAVLLIHAVLLCAARLLLAPTLLIPGGRSDLLLPLTPALLCPLLILRRQGTRSADLRMLIASIVCAGGAFSWLAAAGLSAVHQDRYPLFVPASEMRAVVDSLAARHREHGGGDTIDVGYDLDKGIEWVTARGCRPENSWYSIGRQYDWLLRRRYGLSNVREGSCSRQGGTLWQVGYRGLGVPHGMKVVQTFDHLEIRTR